VSQVAPVPEADLVIVHEAIRALVPDSQGGDVDRTRELNTDLDEVGGARAGRRQDAPFALASALWAADLGRVLASTGGPSALHRSPR